MFSAPRLASFFCSRSARGARADLHAPKAPKSKAEMEAEAAAEELMAKHREVKRSRRAGELDRLVTLLVITHYPLPALRIQNQQKPSFFYFA